MNLYCKAFFVILILAQIKLSSAHSVICKECPNVLEMVLSIFASLLLIAIMALIFACFHCCRLPHGRTCKETIEPPCKPACQECPPPPVCNRRCGTPIIRSTFISQSQPYSRTCGGACGGGGGSACSSGFCVRRTC